MYLSLLHQKTITKLMLAYCVTTVHEVKISKYFKQHVHCLVNCIIQTTTQYKKLQKPVDLQITGVGEDVIGKKTSIQYLSIVISSLTF